MKKATERGSGLLIIVATALFVASMLLASWLLKYFEPSVPVRLALVLLPVPPVALLIFGNVRWLRSLDELQRRIQLEAVGFAFPAGIVGAFTLDYLRAAGFLPEWILRRAWTVMLVLYVASYLIGYLISNRRYR